MKRGLGVLLALAIGFLSVCAQPDTAEAAQKQAQTDPFVVVLDAGHGGSDGGASRTWSGKRYKEKQLNLAIAKACKAELEKYAGVKVYMTRTSDVYVSLDERVLFAKQMGADLFVSLHNNADYKASSNGACVFYPNYNYKKEIGAEGHRVAVSIESKLTSLGLKNLGVAYRNSENRTKYPDKKLADYYRVIKLSKEEGFPGLIVEHAYVSNPSDCRKYLSTPAKLKKLGVADAAGIAEAYGLVKGKTPVLKSVKLAEGNAVSLAWSECAWADGYVLFRRSAGEEACEALAVVSGSGSSYLDTTAAGGQTYEYCLRAYVAGKDRTFYTDVSNTLSVTTIGAPSLVAVSRSDTGQVQLAFTSVDGADGYLIARRADSGESFLVVAELDSGTLVWTDAGADAEHTYEYQVCAYVKCENIKITGAYTPGVMDTIETE
ncbi:MAG: N-acetylmuramoyl-L-alanine amidase [Blautia sp.]|nr:N-acetylmuramoyl-L-alanine amidase [Blautia sp.]